MSRYRTEIVVPSDRVVTLHLPDDFPEGRARLVVEVAEPAEFGGELEPSDADLAADDIEWWDEFEGDEVIDEEPSDLRNRLSSPEA